MKKPILTPYKIIISLLFFSFFVSTLIYSLESTKMEIKSSAFGHKGSIPPEYTCDDRNMSPPLEFSGAPEKTVSFALIVDDPDAPGRVFVHWLAWNIPSKTKSLSAEAHVPEEGRNDFGENAYGGPCPPPGKPHRYFFKLYALDTKLDLPKDSGKQQLENAMKGHILAQAELIGLYQRNRR